jgi:hypothetical protein
MGYKLMGTPIREPKQINRISILFLAILLFTLCACNPRSYLSTEVFTINPSENTSFRMTSTPELPTTTIELVASIPFTSPEYSPTVSRTSIAFNSPTPGPTPTIVPPEQCPPFPRDTLPEDFYSIKNPEILIGKHFQGNADEEFRFLSTELDPLSHFLSLFSIQTGTLAWIERFICWDSYGMPYFEVKDAIILEPFLSDQSLTLDCWIGDQKIYYALAVGSVDINQEPIRNKDKYGWIYDRLDYGYFIDTVQEKFTLVSTTGWICIRPVCPFDVC